MVTPLAVLRGMESPPRLTSTTQYTYGALDAMIRTTIYLPEGLKAALEAKATQEGRTQADIVRDALQQLLRVTPQRSWSALFHSGHSDTSENVDELLADGFGG